jgi:hypothetical protein
MGRKKLNKPVDNEGQNIAVSARQFKLAEIANAPKFRDYIRALLEHADDPDYNYQEEKNKKSKKKSYQKNKVKIDKYQKEYQAEYRKKKKEEKNTNKK